jgi:predicted nuclease of restriction endonuclease-like RecB superfamily
VAFALRDLRFTSRRGGDLPSIHPRLLRDRSMLPRIDIAIQYFESMLGRERRDFEAEVLVHFFGDHKLARGLVACLARAYRFQAPDPAEIVGPLAFARLREAQLGLPKQLRLHLFDVANDEAHGFLWGPEREQVLGRLAARLGLDNAILERLLYLDADEHARLGRIGAEPRPDDVLAQYNFSVLEALLRQAAWIELELDRATAEQAEAALALCASNLVGASLDQAGRILRLEGRQDALGVWSRHGRRVSRTLVQLLERARPGLREGNARLNLRGEPVRLRLTPELLDILAGAPAPSIGWPDGSALDQALSEATALAGRNGLGIRRAPEPQAWQRGVIVPDLLIRTGGQSFLLCLVRSLAQAQRLAPLAQSATSGEPLLFVGSPTHLGPLRAVEANVAPLRRLDGRALLAAVRAAVDGEDVAERLAPSA